jgi:SAM-dependent methyltransferase
MNCITRALATNPGDLYNPPDVSTRDNQQTWDREYRECRSIPSSTRSLPSKALLLLEGLFDYRGVRTVFDAGCGNGRNAVHLAQKGCRVIAADFLPFAIQSVAVHAQGIEQVGTIAPIQVDLLKQLPFPDEAFDLCLDSYVSCHFIDPSAFMMYWREIARVTRSGGYVFSSVFATDDQYYQTLLAGCENDTVIVDPTNGVAKRLYRAVEFKNVLPSQFSITYFWNFQFIDQVMGRDFLRSLFVVLLKKA